MTEQIDKSILPSSKEMEEKMAILKCVYCGSERDVNNSGYYDRSITSETFAPVMRDIIRGYLVCGHCHRRTVFALEGNVFIFLPGKVFEEGLREDVAPNGREMFSEAALCFYGGSNRGVVAFIRSALEEALAAKGVPGGHFDAKITNAKKHGILGDDEVAQAHSARLSGRNALHRMMEVSQLQAVGVLGAAVFLLNHIAQQKPVPASQSGKGSNEA